MTVGYVHVILARSLRAALQLEMRKLDNQISQVCVVVLRAAMHHVWIPFMWHRSSHFTYYDGTIHFNDDLYGRPRLKGSARHTCAYLKTWLLLSTTFNGPGRPKNLPSCDEGLED